jgi:hypothetical protein
MIPFTRLCWLISPLCILDGTFPLYFCTSKICVHLP